MVLYWRMNKIKEANNLKFSKINVGDVFQFEKTLSKEDIIGFAELTGDHNPLHVNEEFGKNSEFGQNIVQGMLAGSLFSTLVGMHCPGKNCLYLSQTLNFRTAIFPGDTMLVKGTVINKSESTKIITLKTEILKQEKVIVNGEAKVRILGEK